MTTAIYCLWLHFRHKTITELVELPAGPEKGSLPINFVMAAVTGLFWYGQFFFYNLGHVRLGDKFAFTSWAIHMIMLVLFSNLMGVLLREWRQCRRLTHTTIGLALVILGLSVSVVLGFVGVVLAAAGLWLVVKMVDRRWISVRKTTT